MERSIAVLPFENRSEDNANAYFAQGIQDEILTRLSKIADLKGNLGATSNASITMKFAGKPAEIGKQLGVASHPWKVLHEERRRSARGNVQLIKAATIPIVWPIPSIRKPDRHLQWRVSGQNHR